MGLIEVDVVMTQLGGALRIFRTQAGSVFGAGYFPGDSLRLPTKGEFCGRGSCLEVQEFPVPVPSLLGSARMVCLCDPGQVTGLPWASTCLQRGTLSRLDAVSSFLTF